MSKKSQKPTKQLIQEFSGFTASKAVVSITKKPKEFMTLNDLEIERNDLQQKMKHLNTYLTRLIEKEALGLEL